MVLSPQSTKPFHLQSTFLYWNTTLFIFLDGTAFVLQFVNWGLYQGEAWQHFSLESQIDKSFIQFYRYSENGRASLGGWAKPLLQVARNCISFPVTLLWRCTRGTPNSRLAAGTTGTKDKKFWQQHEEKWGKRALARKAIKTFQHLKFMCRYKFCKD